MAEYAIYIKDEATMLAAVDKANQCVWGLGKTAQEAMQDAKDQMAKKQPHCRCKLENLEIAHLSDSADLRLDGEMLYQHCIIAADPVQPELF